MHKKSILVHFYLTIYNMNALQYMQICIVQILDIIFDLVPLLQLDSTPNIFSLCVSAFPRSCIFFIPQLVNFCQNKYTRVMEVLCVNYITTNEATKFLGITDRIVVYDRSFEQTNRF